MKFIFSILAVLLSTVSFAQELKFGKYVDETKNENNYIILNPDSTFKFRFAYHTIHEVACGRYKFIKNRIILDYKADMRDRSCNTDVDADSHYSMNNSYYRPDELKVKRNKLYVYEKRQTRMYLLFGPYINRVSKLYYILEPYAKWNLKKATGNNS